MKTVQGTQFLPYPEIVEGSAAGAKPYTIVDSLSVAGLPSTGMVSKKLRLMFVPLTADGASTIRHELAHVRWSPTKLPRVSYDERILLAVEDARINLALEQLGLAVELAPESLRQVTILANQDLARKDVVMFALRAIASLGTNALPSILDALRFGPGDAENVTRRLLSDVEIRLETSRLGAASRQIATFAAAKRAADHVARELARRGFPVPRSKSPRVDFAEGGCCLSCAPPANGVMTRLLRAAEIAGPLGLGDITAAEMMVSEPALPVACSRKKPGVSDRKPLRSGALVRNANRWFSDKAIFRGRANAAGGTVLIDTSASMKLDVESVDRILRIAPGSTLMAIYSGKEGKGELRIVARNGRRATQEGLNPFGTGNLVDLPALKWLAKQPSPRLWLSDGQVTGVHDWASSLLARQCSLVCKRFGIRRVETAEEAAAVLAGRRVQVRPIIP